MIHGSKLNRDSQMAARIEADLYLTSYVLGFYSLRCSLMRQLRTSSSTYHVTQTLSKSKAESCKSLFKEMDPAVKASDQIRLAINIF